MLAIPIPSAPYLPLSPTDPASFAQKFVDEQGTELLFSTVVNSLNFNDNALGARRSGRTFRGEFGGSSIGVFRSMETNRAALV